MVIQRFIDALIIPEILRRPLRCFPGVAKLRHFEFWNTHLFHFPIYLYWLYLSCRARSLFFFSAANPGIETGGMMGESKSGILEKINPRFLPKFCFYQDAKRASGILHELRKKEIKFPFIVKPDVGQGGWMVRLIRNEAELATYLKQIRMPFIIQEYINEPVEVGILYYRMPDRATGVISSFAIKAFLEVVGDGHSNLKELIEIHPRGKCCGVRSEMVKYVDCAAIPVAGEKVVVSFKGNHSYGTTFLNACHLIDDRLTSVFDELCRSINGFYFGRFDIRCKSVDALKSGEFKIIELNGVGSEPLHVFDPSSKLMDAYASVFFHWRIIYRISRLNQRSGNAYMKFREARHFYNYMKSIQEQHGTRVVIGN